jgi:hypothetical protein
VDILILFKPQYSQQVHMIQMSLVLSDEVANLVPFKAMDLKLCRNQRF